MLRRAGRGVARVFSAVLAVLNAVTGLGGGSSTRPRHDTGRRLDAMEQLVGRRERGEISADEFARQRDRLHGF